MEIFSIAFIAVIGATMIFMVLNMFGGILLSNFEHDFDKEILKGSLIKYLGIVVMGLGAYLGFSLIANGLYEGLGINIPIQEIITLGLVKYAYYYGEQVLDKWNELVEVHIKNEGE